MSSFTHHAKQRMQQRGIDATTVDYLLEFGSERYAKGDASIVYFTKMQKNQIMANLEKASRAKLENQLNTHLIIGEDGKIVTVGHLTRRLRKQ